MNWKLQSVSISFRDYGELKGKYIGQIVFENGQTEAFTCNLSPQRCADYLKIIQQEVVANASDLKDKLEESMNLLIKDSSAEILHLTENINS